MICQVGGGGRVLLNQTAEPTHGPGEVDLAVNFKESTIVPGWRGSFLLLGRRVECDPIETWQPGGGNLLLLSLVGVVGAGGGSVIVHPQLVPYTLMVHHLHLVNFLHRPLRVTPQS